MEQSAAVEPQRRDLQDLKTSTQVAQIHRTQIPERDGAGDFLLDARALHPVSAELANHPFAANDPAAFDASLVDASVDVAGDSVVQLDLAASACARRVGRGFGLLSEMPMTLPLPRRTPLRPPMRRCGALRCGAAR